ncbi:MAG TPA: META domain-containing protein [Actinomycetota bacterium]|nr:META domain-containing protein [Actinomycetota bacterium]
MRPPGGRRLASLLLPAAVALMAACGGGDPLDGTSWRAIDAIRGRPVLGGVEATASFSEGDVSGSSSCNSYTGSYEVGSGGAGEPVEIAITNVGGTEMACEPPVMEQEARFVDALLSATRYRITGDRLELMDDHAVVAVFERTGGAS